MRFESHDDCLRISQVYLIEDHTEGFDDIEKDDGTPGRTFGEERVRSVIELELFLESRFSRFCLTEEDD